MVLDICLWEKTSLSFFLHVLCFILYIICFFLHVLCFILYIICFFLHVLCFILYFICFFLHVLCFILYFICFFLHVLCFILCFFFSVSQVFVLNLTQYKEFQGEVNATTEPFDGVQRIIGHRGPVHYLKVKKIYI